MFVELPLLPPQTWPSPPSHLALPPSPTQHAPRPPNHTHTEMILFSYRRLAGRHGMKNDFAFFCHNVKLVIHVFAG